MHLIQHQNLLIFFDGVFRIPFPLLSGCRSVYTPELPVVIIDQFLQFRLNIVDPLLLRIFVVGINLCFDHAVVFPHQDFLDQPCSAKTVFQFFR